MGNQLFSNYKCVVYGKTSNFGTSKLHRFLHLTYRFFYSAKLPQG